MKLVWNCDALPDPTDALTLLRLAWYVDDRKDPERSFSAIRELADVTRHSTRQVQRSLTRLEAAGWITANRAGGRGRAPEFRINVAKLETHQRAKTTTRMSSFSNDCETENYDVDVMVSDQKGDIEGQKGRHRRSKRVTSEAEKGDMGVTTSKEPSKEPSTKPSFLPASPETEKVDLRFCPFRDYYLDWYQRANGITEAWTSREGQELNKLLAKHPDMNIGHFQQILANRESSRGLVTLSEPGHRWLANGGWWLNGPADAFGHPPRKSTWVNRTEVASEYARASGLYEPGGLLDRWGLLDRGVTIEGDGRPELSEGNGPAVRAALPTPCSSQRDPGYSEASNGQRAASGASAAPGPGIVANGLHKDPRPGEDDPVSFGFGFNVAAD
jgi:hypothetical protein